MASNHNPDLSPVDYQIWAVMLHRVYHRQIYSVDALKRRLIDVWCGLELSIFYEAIDQWRGRHRACASVAVRQRLQRIQNSADRLVCSEPAFSHAAPLVTLVAGCQTYKI